MPEPWEGFIDEVVRRLRADLLEEFGPRHDGINQRLDDVEKRLDEIGRLGVEIKRDTRIRQMVDDAAEDETTGVAPPQRDIPLPGADRPTDLDRAYADPTSTPRVAIPTYGNMVIYPKFGADPDTTWKDVTHAIEQVADAEEGSNGLSGPRRAKQR